MCPRPWAEEVEDPVPERDSGAREPNSRLLLVGLFALVTVVASEAMAVATVMPLVERDLGRLWLYGWVFSAFQLATLVGIVIGGRAADRMNPARPLALGMVVFCAGLMVAGAAPSMIVLVAGRSLQGFGAGAIPTVAYVCVGRGFAPVQRPRVFAVLSTAWILPSLVAPLAASVVARGIGWRWVFLGLIPVALIAGAVAVRAVGSLGAPETRSVGSQPEEAGQGHLATVMKLVVGSALLLSGLTSRQWIVALGCSVVGAVLVVTALRTLTPPGTLRLRPRLPAAVGLRGLLTTAFFASDAFVPLAITSVRGRSTFFAGLVMATGAFTWAIGSWLQARLTQPWGAARLVALGALSLACGLTCYLAGLHTSVPVHLWYLGAALAGLGMGIAYSPLSVVTLAEAEPGREGAATTSLQLSDVLGIALGTGAAGAIVAVGERWTGQNATSMAVVLGLSLVLCSAIVVGSPRLVRATHARAPSTDAAASLG